mgnify:CR=1 FL=1
MSEQAQKARELLADFCYALGVPEDHPKVERCRVLLEMALEEAAHPVTNSGA